MKCQCCGEEGDWGKFCSDCGAVIGFSPVPVPESKPDDTPLRVPGPDRKSDALRVRESVTHGE